MSEQPEIERIYGGIGHDNNMVAFGDTVYTIKRMEESMKPNSRYTLKISLNVKRNAEDKECGIDEWYLITKMNRHIELIEPENKDIMGSGKIILENPKHIIISEKLILWWFDGTCPWCGSVLLKKIIKKGYNYWKCPNKKCKYSETRYE